MRPVAAIFNKLDKAFHHFPCLLFLWTFGPLGECGNCCCKQASKAVALAVAKSWKKETAARPGGMSPLSPAGFTSTPSAPTRPVCVSAVVTTRLLRCSAYIPFIPPPPGNPGAPPLPVPAPVRDRDRCTRSADGRQVHGQMASARSVPDWPRCAINGRIELILIRAFFFGGGGFASATEVKNQVEGPCQLLCSRQDN